MTSANLPCGRLGSRTLQDPRTNVLVWDTDVSFRLTPFKSDSIAYVDFNTYMKDVTKYNTIIEMETTIHTFVDANGKYLFLRSISYHVPTTDVQHLSPQTYHQLNGAHSIIK